MVQLKDTQIKSLKDGEEKKESLGRGNGLLVFRRVNRVIPAYYKYWTGKKSTLVKLDNYKQSAKSPGKSLSQLKDQALEMVALRKQVAPLDLKEYLQLEEAKQLRQQKEELRKQGDYDRLGTFEDLMRLYGEDLEDRGTESASYAIRSIKNMIIKPYPVLAHEKACNISPEDIRTILHPIYKRDALAMHDQIRAYLSAAFNFGMRFDFDPSKDTGNKIFSIQSNPVTRFRKMGSKSRKRELTHDELRKLWMDAENHVFGVNSKYGLFVQFCITCFGNRPTQLSRIKWRDINIEQRSLMFIDSKGKRGPRTTIIPLTDRALDILNRLVSNPQRYGFTCSQEMVQPDRYIFSSVFGHGKMDIDELGNRIRDYNREQPGCNEDSRWTIKDFRRTCVSIMTSARIIKERRYLLQSRTDGSVESIHYDVSDRMDEKQEEAAKFDAMLDRILYTDGHKKTEYGDSTVINCIKEMNNPSLSFVEPIKPRLTDSYREFRQDILETRRLKCREAYVRDGYSNRKMRRWFRQLEKDQVIKKQGRRYVLRPASDFRDNLTEEVINNLSYETLKQEILDTGKVRSQVDYILEGYGDKRVQRIFKALVSEGILVKVGQTFMVKAGSEIKAMDHEARTRYLARSYEVFKQTVLVTGQLMNQKEYRRHGYSDKQIRNWFKRLADDDIIEKVGQRYQLKVTEQVA